MLTAFSVTNNVQGQVVQEEIVLRSTASKQAHSISAAEVNATLDRQVPAQGARLKPGANEPKEDNSKWLLRYWLIKLLLRTRLARGK